MSFLNNLLPKKDYRVEIKILDGEHFITHFYVSVKARFGRQAKNVAMKRLNMVAGQTTVIKNKK